jgi:hypothetical protein
MIDCLRHAYEPLQSIVLEHQKFKPIYTKRANFKTFQFGQGQGGRIFQPLVPIPSGLRIEI